MNSREQFESWGSIQPWFKPEQDPKERDDSEFVYADFVTDMTWLAWQKSRSSLVIDLPQQSGVNLDWNQAIRYCHQAIEAAGAKVRP